MIRWVVEPVTNQRGLIRRGVEPRRGTRGTLYLFSIPLFSWTRWTS